MVGVDGKVRLKHDRAIWRGQIVCAGRGWYDERLALDELVAPDCCVTFKYKQVVKADLSRLRKCRACRQSQTVQQEVRCPEK